MVKDVRLKISAEFNSERYLFVTILREQKEENQELKENCKRM